MKELKPVGKVKNVKMRIFYDFKPGDRLSADDEPVVDKEEFFKVLDKASQPIKHEAESEKEQS